MHRIESLAAKWRFVCPRSFEQPHDGHTNWHPIDGKFRCRTCADRRGVDPEYTELIDTKTGERVVREAIVLDVERGGQVHG